MHDGVIELGPLWLRYDLPTLREVRCRGVELLRALLPAVRDRNWGTVPAEVAVEHHEATRDRFECRFLCRHDNGDVGFVWDGQILGTSTGATVRLSYVMKGRAVRDFRANRIGFCVLHPAEAAGAKASLRTETGVTTARFPTEISPWQPFLGLVGMSYAIDGSVADINFEDDIYETEDQRNWTDASFKTYCPPLSLPYPRLWRRGQEVVQRISLEFPNEGSPIVGYRGHGPQPLVRLQLGPTTSARLPGIGLATPFGHGPVGSEEVEALRRLALHHLHLVVEIGNPHWESCLESDLELASQLDLPVQCELVVQDTREANHAMKTMRELVRRVRTKVTTVMPFDRKTSLSTPELVASWRSAASASPSPALFAGSRANFAELNRAKPTYKELDGVTFAINPQVHAFSNDEIMQTLPVQGLTARQAISASGGLPLHVGPITLLPRFNAVATDIVEPGPAPADERQPSLFTAAWTLGSIGELARAGASTATYFETFGPGGVMQSSPARRPHLFPVYAVVRAMARDGQAPLVSCVAKGDDAALALVAVEARSGLHVCVGNLSEATLAVAFDEPCPTFDVCAVNAGSARKMWEGEMVRPSSVLEGGRALELAPHEVALLSAT